MFGPFLESFDWVKAHNPGSPFKKRQINFLTIHYLYILALAIIGSILLYPAGGMHYVDALFFACGCATQSGLNTIDINRLNTYQQVVFYFMAMVANPVFINTFVVFVRLYWFEQRFQHVVREARNMGRTRTRSRTKTEARPDTQDPGLLEKGVNGRNIVVLRNQGSRNGSEGGQESTDKPEPEKELDSTTASSSSQRDATEPLGTRTQPPLQQPPTIHREVTFADEVDRKKDTPSALPTIPQRLTPEQHIAFLENQRNPKDKGTLRIPGPRESDRGDVPETVADDDNAEPLNPTVTSPVERKDPVNGTPVKRNITIDEPDHQVTRTDTGMFSKLLWRKTGNTEGLKAASTDDIGPPSARLRSRTSTFTSLRPTGSREKDPMPYLSWQPTMGRNSAFVDLTEEQREELGGIEYRSLKTLAVVLVTYYFFFHLIGVVTLTPWIVRSQTWGSVVDNDGLSRSWWQVDRLYIFEHSLILSRGIFTSASMFNDLGFTLTPDSMISFQRAVLPLLLGSFLIVIGNTGFPCMLRFVIWLTSFLVPKDSGVWEELKFLLDHPRRCFTLLFPSAATWWLFWILVGLNGLDLIFFIILDLNDPAVTDIGTAGYRVLNGLFQAVSTRTAGFSDVNLSNLHPGIQVSYLIMMYISVFPIAISVRRTNVYEEKSLGIWGSTAEEEEDDKEPSYVGAHLRRQLQFDLWYIFLGLFIIAIAEGPRLQNPNDSAFTLFACLFEIVSAYGTVGLSLGYTNINASFSTEFTVVSKLVIIAMMVRGRHRGLPYALDRAILLPSESLHKKEDEDAAKRLQRRGSNASAMETSGIHLSRPPTGATEMDTRDEAAIVESGASAKANAGHTRGALGRIMAGLANHPHLETREQKMEEKEKEA